LEQNNNVFNHNAGQNNCPCSSATLVRNNSTRSSATLEQNNNVFNHNAGPNNCRVRPQRWFGTPHVVVDTSGE